MERMREAHLHFKEAWGELMVGDVKYREKHIQRGGFEGLL